MCAEDKVRARPTCSTEPSGFLTDVTKFHFKVPQPSRITEVPLVALKAKQLSHSTRRTWQSRSSPRGSAHWLRRVLKARTADSTRCPRCVRAKRPEPRPRQPRLLEHRVTESAEACRSQTPALPTPPGFLCSTPSSRVLPSSTHLCATTKHTEESGAGGRN